MAEESTEKRKPGRPKGEPMTSVATRLTAAELETLDAYAYARGTNRATVLADLVRRLKNA